MTDLTRGRCGDPLNGFTEVTEKCELLAGHAGWHRGQYGTEWTAAAQGADDLTPEALAEWREEAGYGCVALDADDVLALLDALAAEKAAREEAEAREGNERVQAGWEKARADENEKRRARAERRADKAEQERVLFVRGYRLHDDGSMSPIERWVKRADGQWVSLDSNRATYSDIQMVVD